MENQVRKSSASDYDKFMNWLKITIRHGIATKKAGSYSGAGFFQLSVWAPTNYFLSVSGASGASAGLSSLAKLGFSSLLLTEKLSSSLPSS